MIWIAAAIIILFLLIKFPRNTVFTGLGIIALIVLIVTWVSVKSCMDKSEEDKVTIQISFAPASCGEGYPLNIGFINGSSKTVNEINWSIEGYLPGYSENALEYSSEKSDKILKPGEQFFLCYKVPNIKRLGVTPSQLTYKPGKYYSIYFQN